ncbi:MAG: hypothetical protein HC897_03800 [Thermoanaerobaculia bacterium]|nr:hypothetical protein [Thermoanaerobaculia bacterium]
MSAVATLFNPGASVRRARLEVLENPSGKPLATFEATVAGGEVASFELLSMLESARPGLHPESLGLRIRSEDGPILAQVVAFDTAGVAIDVPVFDVRDGHLSGAYPVVDPREGNTVATLVNVGDEPSKVGAQLSWSGGEYAAGPWEVAPGAMLTIDVAELIARQEADLLGRTPAAEEMTQGFLQWQALRGSLTLLGRTELHPAGSNDLAGFNCKLCCEMESFGQLSPGSVTFPVGSTVGFQATELISTCSGLSGPYVLSPSILNYSSPMIWNGATIRSSGANHQIVSFEDEGVLTLPTCETFTPQIFDDGPATAFQVTIQTVDLPNDLIRIQLSSGQMSVDGQLRVTLRNSAGTDLRTIATGSYGTGTHVFDFGDLATYPANTKVASVYATWTAAGQTKTASFPYVFTALGLYWQTCYNTPYEAEFAATPTFMAGFTAGPNACVWGARSFRTRFLDEVNENGNGVNLSNQEMQPEFSCGNAPPTSPPYCDRYKPDRCRRYRIPTPIRTSCGNPLTIGTTVARDTRDTNLTCAMQIFIDGMGRRTVQDSGTFPMTPALDHYQGVGNVACAPWNNVQRATFRLGS